VFGHEFEHLTFRREGSGKLKFLNTGSFVHGGEGRTVIEIPAENYGNIKVRKGTLDFTDTLNQRGNINMEDAFLFMERPAVNYGRITGTGSIFAESLVNFGYISPGLSPGTLIVDGEFVQSEAGVLELEIGGVLGGEEHDVLQINGTATISGQIVLSFIDGFAPAVGQSFELIQSPSLFVNADVKMTGLAPGFEFEVAVDQGAWMLRALNDGVFMGDVLAGDYNENGEVEQGDLDLVLLNWSSELIDPAVIGWTNDLPTGRVDQDELDKVLLAWGNFSTVARTAGVPEPSGTGLALVALTVVLLYSGRSDHRR
jgi:hypothetical protein